MYFSFRYGVFKRTLIFLVGLWAMVVMQGCVHVEVDMELKADGSGTMKLQYEMFRNAPDDFARLASAMEIHPRELDIDPRTEVMPNDLTRVAMDSVCVNYGVEIVNCKHSAIEEWDRVNLTLQFDHVDQLGMVLLGSTGKFSGLADISQLESGEYQMVVDRPFPPVKYFWENFPDALPIANRADAVLDSMIANSKDAAIAYILSRPVYLYSFFTATLRVTLPAIPTEHNATQIEGRTCTWVYGADDARDFMVRPRPYMRFPSSGLAIVARKYGH